MESSASCLKNVDDDDDDDDDGDDDDANDGNDAKWHTSITRNIGDISIGRNTHMLRGDCGVDRCYPYCEPNYSRLHVRDVFEYLTNHRQ